MKCNICGCEAGNANFCPSCGARMRPGSTNAGGGSGPLDSSNPLEHEVTLWQGKPSNIRDRLKWFFNSTRYTITNQRVIIRRGLLSKTVEEVDHRTIKDYKVKQSVGERVLKTGDLIIISVDPSMPKLELRNIPDAEGVKEILRKAVLSYKRYLGVNIEEKL